MPVKSFFERKIGERNKVLGNAHVIAHSLGRPSVHAGGKSTLGDTWALGSSTRISTCTISGSDVPSRAACDASRHNTLVRSASPAMEQSACTSSHARHTVCVQQRAALACPGCCPCTTHAQACRHYTRMKTRNAVHRSRIAWTMRSMFNYADDGNYLTATIVPFIQPIKGIKSIQLDFSHAVGAAEFGLFESGAPPPASARWAVVGSGLGPIDKVRSCPQASNSCPFCPIQCLAHHRQHVHRVASQTLLARASRTRLLIVHVRRGRHARCARPATPSPLRARHGRVAGL